MSRRFNNSAIHSIFSSVEISSLQSYALMGDLENVRKCLENGDDPNIPDADGDTPLSAAASKGRIEVMKLLISCGANVNHITKPSRPGSSLVSMTRPELSILLIALNRCQFEAAKLLVEKGAFFGLEAVVLRAEFCLFFLEKFKDEAATNPKLHAYIAALNEIMNTYLRTKDFKIFFPQLKKANETLGVDLPLGHPVRSIAEGIASWLISRLGGPMFKFGSAILIGKQAVLATLQMTEEQIEDAWLTVDRISDLINHSNGWDESYVITPSIAALDKGLEEYLSVRGIGSVLEAEGFRP